MNLALVLGLDLDPSDSTEAGFFIDVAETGLSAAVNASASDLNFSASLGPATVAVQDGMAEADASLSFNLVDADGDGRLQLVGFDGGALSSDLGNLGAFVDPANALDGGAEILAMLPLYYGLGDFLVPAGDTALRDFQDNVPAVDGVTPDPDGSYFSNNFNTDGVPGLDDNRLPGNAIGLYVDLVEAFTPGGDDGFELRLPDFDFNEIPIPSLFALLADPAKLVSGLDKVVGEIEDLLQGEIFGFEIPLIGDALKDNPVSNILGDFREDVLQDLVNKLRASNANLEGLVGLIENALDNAFMFDTDGDNVDDFNALTGPTFADAGFDFLTLSDGGSDFVITRFLDGAGAFIDPTSGSIFNDANAIQFDFDIGAVLMRQLANFNLSLPIPAFQFEAMADPMLELGFNVHFGFGIDVDQGFYITTDYDNVIDSTAKDEEITAYAEINLGPSASFDAQLLFLKLGLNDGADLDGLNGVESDEKSRARIDFSLDLKDPNADTTPALEGAGGSMTSADDGRLTLPELISSPVSETLSLSAEGTAQFIAEAVVSFPGEAANVLPSIQTDIIAAFSIGYDTIDGLTLAPPEFAFANIELDLGDFISGFAGDLLNGIADVLGPLDWLIGPDGLLNLKIPLVSELLGETIRFRDLISLFDPKNGPKVNTFLDFVENLYFLVDLVESASSEGGGFMLPFGDFIVAKNSVDSFFDDATVFAGDFFDSISILTGITDLGSTPDFSGLSVPSLPDIPDVPDAAPSTTKRFKAGVTEPGSIEFPILQPENIFKLLLGQPDITLFTVRVPRTWL